MTSALVIGAGRRGWRRPRSCSAGLDGLVGHLGVLRPDGRPAVHAVASSAAPGLWFIGLTTPISGVLREIGRDAERIAAAIVAG